MGMRCGFVLAAMLTASLAGCGTAPSVLPLACPTPGLLAEGADLTRYRPGPVRDLTTMEYDARLIGLNGGCNPGRGDRSIDMQLSVSFAVDRGAAAEGRTVDLPWFVAVVDRRTDEVLSRQGFVERLEFARNETRTSGTGNPVSITLPVGEQRRAADYRILVSFELSAEDLALNRRRGPR
jgi:hypothetical protein